MVWDDFGDDTHLTEPQVFQLYQRLQKEYETGTDDKNSFTPFYIQEDLRDVEVADEEKSGFQVWPKDDTGYLTESRALELYKRLQEEYGTGDEVAEQGECEDCGGEVNLER